MIAGCACCGEPHRSICARCMARVASADCECFCGRDTPPQEVPVLQCPSTKPGTRIRCTLHARHVSHHLNEHSEDVWGDYYRGDEPDEVPVPCPATLE